ncbi:MAG: FHA domain-containing protein [Acidobacteria bacterium]|nr:FHA domain-containing protein [Acidobacteriota bacterium]
MSDLNSVEQQLRDWIDQLAPEHKHTLLLMLAEDDRLRRAARLEFAVVQLRRLCVERELDWDAMVESERENFLDNLIRENELYATQIGKSSLPSIAPCLQCGREITPADLYRIYFGERPPSIERAAAKLVVLDVEVDAQFPLAAEGEVTIGRLDPHRGIRPDVDLSKYDPASRISRRHARVTVRGHQFFVEDLGSANGTIVNGNKRLKPQEPYPLANGDVLKIGETTLKFVG